MSFDVPLTADELKTIIAQKQEEIKAQEVAKFKAAFGNIDKKIQEAMIDMGKNGSGAATIAFSNEMLPGATLADAIDYVHANITPVLVKKKFNVYVQYGESADKAMFTVKITI